MGLGSDVGSIAFREALFREARGHVRAARERRDYISASLEDIMEDMIRLMSLRVRRTVPVRRMRGEREMQIVVVLSTMLAPCGPCPPWDHGRWHNPPG